MNMTTNVKGLLLCAVAVLVMGTVTVEAAELIEKLPKETIVYARIDLGTALTQSRKWAEFVDAESGGTIIFQTQELHRNLKEVLAAQYEFKAKLLDNLDSLKLHFVLAAKEEPVLETHTSKIPAYDPETRQIIPGKFNEHTYTTTKVYDFTIIGETSPEIAADFMTQFKALMERQKEKNPDSKNFDYTKVEVERGELLSSPESFGSLGRIEGLIVFSEDISKKTWGMLCAAPSASLGDDEVYRRLSADPEKPFGSVLFNIEQYVRTHEKSLVFALEEAKKKAEEEAKNPDPKKSGREQWKVLRAQSKLGSFQLWKNLFGLERIGVAGMNTYMTIQDKAGKSGMRCLVQIKEPLPVVLKLLLDSGHMLEVPSIVKPDTMCYMLRLGADRMLYEIMTAVGEDKAQAVTTWLEAAKTNIGLDVPALMPHLAGDVYLFLDMVKKEKTFQTYEMVEGSDERKLVTKKIDMVVPEILVLIGLKDGKAFGDLLSTTFAAVSTSPKGASFVKKRTYQETDVYLVGPGVSEEGADPDGMNSFAVVVVDRYLSFGSWKDVTGLIRKTRTAESEEGRKLAEVVAGNEGANLIAVVPKAFIKKLKKLNEPEPGAPSSDIPTGPLDMVLKMLEQTPLPIEDEALNKKVKDGIAAWVKALTTLSEKSQDMGPEMSAMYGRLTNGFYEIRSDQEIRKPAE